MLLTDSSSQKSQLSQNFLGIDIPRILSYAVFLSSCLFLGILEYFFRPYGFDGFYFQNLTSDAMMQTLPVATLKAEPLASLFYLHIQPPMFDTIRTLLVLVAPSADPANMLRFVDSGLYVILLILFGFLNTLIYTWVTKITNSVTIGIIAAILWLFHPASILYATMLDGTFLSSFLITWMIYEIWLMSKNQGSYIRLGLAASLTFLTRTVFQWYFAPVLGVCLFLLPINKRKGLLTLSIFCTVIFLYCGKQYLLFNTLSTTTYGGYHKTGIIWYQPDRGEIQRYVDRIQAKYPEGAKRIRDRNNNETTWQHNLAYNAIFSNKVKEDFLFSLGQIAKSFIYNFYHYWQPSSRCGASVITPRILWRNAYDWVFSFWRLWLLLLISLVVWFISAEKRNSQRIYRFLGHSVLVGYILMITHLCNRLDWTEAGRLKFFLEPVFFVFIISQLTALIRSFANDRNQ